MYKLQWPWSYPQNKTPFLRESHKFHLILKQKKVRKKIFFWLKTNKKMLMKKLFPKNTLQINKITMLLYRWFIGFYLYFFLSFLLKIVYIKIFSRLLSVINVTIGLKSHKLRETNWSTSLDLTEKRESCFRSL